MDFLEALSYINNGNYLTYMTREDWPYKLYFCPDSQYLMIDAINSSVLTPYTISTYDFEHQWEIIKS